MATISAGDLIKLRTGQQAARLYLSVFRPTVLLAALINESSPTPGMRQIDYDGGTGTGFSLIEGGQPLYYVSPGGRVRRVRIKSITGNQTSGTITLAENSEVWADNGVIYVTHDYPLFPILPSFDAETEVFRKDTGTGATGQTYADVGAPNSQPPPVTVVGVPAFVDWYRGSNVVFSVDLNDSYAVADGAAVATFGSVSIAPSGAGLTGTMSSITGLGTLTATQAGQWWVRYGVTDTNGKIQYAYRRVITTEPERDFTVNGGVNGGWDAGGYAFQVAVHGEATLADYPDEAFVMLWHENVIGNSEDYVNIWGVGDKIISSGYILADSSQDDYDTDTGAVTFQVETPESLLATRTEAGNLELRAVATPAEWYEYATWLTVGRAIHHHLKWHSTALEVLDIWGLKDNLYKLKFVTFNESSLLQRDNNLAGNNGIDARLASDRLGRLHLVRDSQLLPDADRSGLDTVFELTAADVSGQFTTVRQPALRVIQTSMNGFTYDGTTSTPLLAIAPGSVPENTGTARLNRSGQVLEDQAELNDRTGRWHAVANADLVSESVTLRGNYLGAFDIIPSLGLYGWGLVDNTLKRELALNGKRLICREVQISFEYQDRYTGRIGVQAGFDWEVEGESGQTDTYPGFPECPPGAGSTGHIEDDSTPGDEQVDGAAFPPVTLLSFSSVNYRPLSGAADWVQLLADAVLYGTIDKFWHIKAGSYDPNFLIVWVCGAGFVGAFGGLAATTMVDMSPSSNPPDTWADTPDPTVATVNFIQVESDAYTQDEFYVLTSFQNGSSLYRGWVAKRSAGVAYSYLPLYDTGGSLPAQSRPIFMAITCTHVLVTVWQDLATDKLKLLAFTKDPWEFEGEYDLGDCTATQLDNRELIAFPAATPDYSATSPDGVAPWYVAGRMDDPLAAFGEIVHVINYDGTTWGEVALLGADEANEDWGTDYCAALRVGPDVPDGREHWAARVSP